MSLPKSDRAPLADELAEGVDLGWDEVATAPASAHPSSAPLPADLDALDADWDTDEPDAADSEPNPKTPGSVTAKPPQRFRKKELRDAERQKKAHAARRKAENKEERKRERREEARRASDFASNERQRALAAERAAHAHDSRFPSPARAPEPRKPAAAGKTAGARLAPAKSSTQSRQIAGKSSKHNAPSPKAPASRWPWIVWVGAALLLALALILLLRR